MTAVPIPQFVDLMLIISNHHGLFAGRMVFAKLK